MTLDPGCCLPSSQEAVEDERVEGGMGRWRAGGTAGPGQDPCSQFNLALFHRAGGLHLRFHLRPVPMQPWPSPRRQIRACPETITISRTTLRFFVFFFSPEASLWQSPARAENILFFHFMNEQSHMLSINVCVNHRWAFPSWHKKTPIQTAQAASSPGGRPRGHSLHFFWALGSCLLGWSLVLQGKLLLRQ